MAKAGMALLMHATAIAGAAATPKAVAAPVAAAAASQQQQARDLAYAREYYVLRSAALSDAQRQQALGYIAARLHERRPYSEAEFLVILLRIAAFADNGHDYFDNGQGWWPAARLPLTLAAFPDALLVTHAPPGQADLVGARIAAIDGLPTEALLRQLHDYFGGPPNYVRWSGMWAIETAQILHAMGLARRADSLQLTLHRRDGRRITRRIAFVPYAAWAGGNRMHSLQREPGNAPQPLYLQQPDQLFRRLRLPEADALYLQFRSHTGSAAEPILPFIAAATQELADRGARNLILDLRFDSGGNSELSMALMETIARSVSGKIYIITGEHTFSAGIVTAAKLKQAAGARAPKVQASAW
ncbi:MAG: hypothetical protein ACEQSK_04870 [Sphingomonadaceae bacterium]